MTSGVLVRGGAFLLVVCIGIDFVCDCSISANSAGCCSGDAEDEPALRSRSSNRFFSFLPVIWSVHETQQDQAGSDTYGSFAERCGSVSAFVPRDPRSLSNPRLGWQKLRMHCSCCVLLDIVLEETHWIGRVDSCSWLVVT